MQMLAGFDHHTRHLTTYAKKLNGELNHILHHNDVEYDLQSNLSSPFFDDENEEEDEDKDDSGGDD